jgi:hypothetical protein
MQNFIVEYAEPSVLPRIHFNEEEKEKGAVDFLEPFLNSSTSTTTASPSWTKGLATKIGQAINATVSEVADQLTNLVVSTEGHDGQTNLIVRPPTAPSTVAPSVRNQTRSTSFQPGSPSQVKMFFYILFPL